MRVMKCIYMNLYKVGFFFFFRATETLLFRGLWIRLGQFVLRGLRIITNEVVLKV